MNARIRQERLSRLAGQFLRGFAITALVVVGLMVGLATVFWDADFDAARSRWEYFKTAMFGPWHAPSDRPAPSDFQKLLIKEQT